MIFGGTGSLLYTLPCILQATSYFKQLQVIDNINTPKLRKLPDLPPTTTILEAGKTKHIDRVILSKNRYMYIDRYSRAKYDCQPLIKIHSLYKRKGSYKYYRYRVEYRSMHSHREVGYRMKCHLYFTTKSFLV